MDLTPFQLAEMKELVAQGNYILAIKKVRGWTGLGLKEAKDFVDASVSRMRTASTSAPPATPAGGVLGNVDALIRSGHTIEAIKACREVKGCDLQEAKNFVDQRRKELGARSPERVDPMVVTHGKGCLMIAMALVLGGSYFLART